MTLVEHAVKTAAIMAIDKQIDTLVTENDLECVRAPWWCLNHSYILRCPEFTDFYVKVLTDRNGVPKKTTVYIEK